MRIALCAENKDLFSKMDSRFARADMFLIYDTDGDHSFEQVDNSLAKHASQGAGIQAVETLIRHNVDCIVTGECGPKALEALKSSGIKLFTTKQETAALALQEVLSKITSAV